MGLKIVKSKQNYKIENIYVIEYIW
jgi:hypothetical protein